MSKNLKTALLLEHIYVSSLGLGSVFLQEQNQVFHM